MVSITSSQNPSIKNVVKLNDRHDRDKLKRTVVEGIYEISRVLEMGIIPFEAYICKGLISTPEAENAYRKLAELENNTDIRVFDVPPVIFEKMAYRGSTGGILAVVPFINTSLSHLPKPKTKPFYVIVEGGEKPGNVGAILRTADAAGVDGLIISEGTMGGTDIHNPNAIRASLGAIFTVPIASAPTQEVMQWLKDQNIRTVAATPYAKKVFTSIDMKEAVAIVTGSESDGLSELWLDNADEKGLIPMSGKVDSLNLSISTALFLYEVVRQRSI